MKGNKHIVFRVDGGNEIGLGHFVRCLALAEMLNVEFTCSFAMLHPDYHIKNQVLATGNQLIQLTNDALVEFLKKLEGFEIVVLDGYSFNEAYQQGIKWKGCKLVSIDDMNKQHFYADAVINHALTADSSQYSVEPYTAFLFGSDYILLRKPFLEASKHRQSKTSFKKVFVCFGGADKDNISYSIVSILATINFVQKITVVVGAAYLGSIHELKAISDLVSVYQNISPEEIIVCMEGSDFGIVPASGIAYECAAVGLPFITGHYVKNQELFYTALTKQKNIIGVAAFNGIDANKLNEAIDKLILMYSPAEKKFIDGKQQERYLKEFNKLVSN